MAFALLFFLCTNLLADPVPRNSMMASSPAVVTLSVKEDSYIDPWRQSTSLGLNNILNSSSSPSNQYTTIFLKFDISGLPPNSTVKVLNVTLTLSLVNSSSLMGDMIAAYGEYNNTWSENTLNYANAPKGSISSTPIDPKPANSSLTTWNVTRLVEPQLGVNNTVSIVLHHYGAAPSSNTLILFKSKEWGSLPPTLTVRYRKNLSSMTTVVAPSKTIFGSPILINATLKPAMTTGNIAVQFSTDNQTWSNIVSRPPGPNGIVTTIWYPPVATTYSIRSTWSGDTFTNASTSSIQVLSISRAATSISVVLGASTISYGSQVLAFALMSPRISEGIALIEYSADDGSTWSTLEQAAPANGILSQTFIPTFTGLYLFRARWLGDANYNASSSGYQFLSVEKAQTSLTIIYAPPVVQVGSATPLSGFLRTTTGTAISGATVVLQIQQGSASGFTNLTALQTGIDGSFAYPWTPNTNGTYVIRACYGGNDYYEPSPQCPSQRIVAAFQVFPTPTELALITGTVGFLIGLGASLLVRFRRTASVRRRQRFGGAKNKAE